MTIVLVGAFILIYETVAADVPNWRLIAAGITCLVAPPALRWDLRVRRGGNGDDD